MTGLGFCTELCDKVGIRHTHVGIEGNELADRMAVFGIDQMAPEICRYSEALNVSEILAYRSG